jgi:hypothetical protein
VGDSRVSRILCRLTAIGRTIVGERWEITPKRTFAAGIAVASSAVFAVFLFWVLNTGRHSVIQYFRRVSTAMMYGLWFGVLAVYLLLLGYADANYFSGKATKWWQIASRALVVTLALVNASQWFWSAWVAIVSGTPTLGELATMGYWKYLFLFNPSGKWGGLYALVMLPMSWYLPYFLIQEFDSGKWWLPALIGSPIVLAAALVYYQVGPPAMPFIGRASCNAIHSHRGSDLSASFKRPPLADKARRRPHRRSIRWDHKADNRASTLRVLLVRGSGRLSSPHRIRRVTLPYQQ